MALTVQNPVTPVGDANSYQSLADARALAVTYAVTLPVDDAECETALINGLLYIGQRENELCGTRTTEAQNTAYPRTGVVIRGNDLPADEFPLDLLVSQIIAAEAFGQGVDLYGGIDDGKNIASEQAGKVSVSYFDNGKTGSGVSYHRFDSALEPLLCVNDAIGFPIGGQTWLR